VGLLLLRAAAGIVLLVQGMSLLVDGNDSILKNSIIALLAVASGVSLMFGFMTPFGSVLATLLNALIALSWLPQEVSSVVQTKQAGLVAVIATALALLGPGAFSIDSRLFGRREIVIPQFPKPPKL
jgi:uncharacterized membrane protein YphA (DoxX/SURF4 family)